MKRFAWLALALMGTAPSWQSQNYSAPENVFWFYRAYPDGSMYTTGGFRASPVGADTSLTRNQWDASYVTASHGWKFSLSRSSVNLRDGWYSVRRITGVDTTMGTYWMNGDQCALAAVDDSSLTTSAVTTAKLATGAVTTAKITDANVTTAKLADEAVTLAKMAANAVDSTKTVDGALSPTDLASNGAATGDHLTWNGTKWDNKDPISELRWNGLSYTDCNTITSTIINSSFPWATTAISSGAMSDGTPTASHPGVYVYSSSATANSGVRVKSQENGILIAGGEYFEAILQLVTSANTTLRIGYHDATSSTAPVDGCWIEVNGTTLDGRTASNSTSSTTATSYTVSTSTWYRVTVQVNAGATSVAFACYNDSGTSLWSNTLTTNIPTGAGRYTGSGFIATNSAGGTVDLAALDWMLRMQNGRSFTR